jgi:hypothetical protein
MKNSLLSAAIITLIATAASADGHTEQKRETSQTEVQNTSENTFGINVAPLIPAFITAQTILGAPIYAQTVDAETGRVDWVEFGLLDNIILNEEKIESLLVKAGGFHGLGTKLINMPLSDIGLFPNPGDPENPYLVTSWTPEDINTVNAYSPETTDNFEETPDLASIQGAHIFGGNGDIIADVENVFLDSDGKILSITTDVGGFLGMGNKLVEIPIEDLNVLKVEGVTHLKTSITRDQIENLPQYLADEK